MRNSLIRIVLGGLFVSFAILKITTESDDSGLLPRSVLILVAAFELAAGSCLIAAKWVVPISFFSALFFVAGLAIGVLAYPKGGCGCLGSVTISRTQHNVATALLGTLAVLCMSMHAKPQQAARDVG